MFENLTLIEKSSQTENLTLQVLRILSGKDSNLKTLKFISQLQEGNIFNAKFLGKISGGKGALSVGGNKIILKMPKTQLVERQNSSNEPYKIALDKGQMVRVQVVSSGKKPALKMVLPQTDATNNEEIITTLTSRAKAISKNFGFDGPLTSTNSQSLVINANISAVLDSKTLLVETSDKTFRLPVEKADSFILGSKIRVVLNKTEAGQVLVSIEKEASTARKIDIQRLKPYLPARLPITQMVGHLKSEIIDSPLITDLKIKPELVASLQNTVRLLTPAEGDIPGADKIRQQVELSGIKYEARVRQALEFPLNSRIRKEVGKDLKGLLLELYNSTGQRSVKEATSISRPLVEFRQTLKYAIDSIEINQLSSQLSKQENQPLIIQIPNPLSSGNKTIQLFIREDYSEDGKEEEGISRKHSISFFLELSVLGKIKINAQLGIGHLSLKIDVENEMIAEFIRHKSKDFEEKMRGMKIQTSVECSVKEGIHPIKDSLIELLVNKNTSLVNIKT